ncbi:MAG: recombination mediator RecR [Candidatus Sericytochromatia bacterium]|nr:recombination mediator RecR [Candidatus Sericytochromatia bacterium]
MLYTRPLARLIEELEKLPGIGSKSSQRLAFHLIKQPEAAIETLAQTLLDAKRQVRFCSTCQNLSADDPCEICLHPNRDRRVVCVIAEPRDLVALERTREFKGLYHVLGGLMSPLDGVGPEQLKVKELLARLQTQSEEAHTVQEVILALNPSVEGEATSLYLSRLLKPAGLRVTRIAFGLPMGGDLEYADEMTLVKALEGRREVV